MFGLIKCLFNKHLIDKLIEISYIDFDGEVIYESWIQCSCGEHRTRHVKTTTKKDKNYQHNKTFVNY